MVGVPREFEKRLNRAIDWLPSPFLAPDSSAGYVLSPAYPDERLQ
jgi:hypothetical protein